LQNKNKLERKIYENALDRMEKMGSQALMHPHLIERRDVIKNSLLDYYESTEEYEKCKYVTEFFFKLEKELLVNSIVQSAEQKSQENNL
jgi:glucosamine 6-phosphate synthetase-like amidotransferase/phosphosugar isomerase protein